MSTKLDARQSVLRSALGMVGSAANDSLDTLFPKINDEIAKLYEDRNIELTDGGIITYTGTTCLFTENLNLVFNSRVAGGAPVVISLGQATRSFALNGAIMYAVVDRTLGTAVITEDSATLPAVTSANQEVFLIAKREDSGDGVKRIYFRNGMALDEGQSARLGASGAGNGNADSLQIKMEERLVDSPFQLLTPYIIRVAEDDLMDVSSTATYSLVDKSINFSGIGQTFVSKQLLDPVEFLANGLNVTAAEMIVYWKAGFVDPAAVYEFSRNGGNEWQVVDMEQIGSTPGFRGYWNFADEASNQTLQVKSLASSDASTNLDNGTARARLSQVFTVTETQLVRTVTLRILKNGSPAGNYKVSIVRDNAGDPSADLADLMSESSLQPVSALAGTANVVVDVPDVVLLPGTYHIVFEADALYRNSYSNGVTDINLRREAAGTPAGKSYNGSVWAAVTGQFVYEVKGIVLDLRVRITSSVVSAKLDAVGALYELQTASFATGVKKIEVFQFSGSLNTVNFVVSNFIPDPDLLRIYDVNTGQVYVYGAFSIDGNTIKFASGQFYNPGTTITLLFDQSAGGSFDNSDLNALLMATNHLGDPTGTADRSIAGRGIYLKRPDGTMREIAIDDNDNIVVYSV